MIHEVQITDPLDWLEASNKATDGNAAWRKSTLHPKHLEDFAYELGLPNLKGQTHRFSLGLNVIAGPNGSGKSSLINLISRITGCDREFHSTFDPNGFTRNAQDGLYSCCRVKADYGISTFCLQVPDALTEHRRNLSLEIGMNAIRTREKSNGQRTMLSIENLLNVFNTDGAILSNVKPRHIRDFKLHVTDPIADEDAKRPNTVWALIKDYYVANDTQPQTVEGKILTRPITFLLDSPDAGLDVPNLHLLYNFLLKAVAHPNRFQFIVSLNSALLIRSLAMIQDVNWIELHKGYLANIVSSTSKAFMPPHLKERKPSEQTQQPAQSSLEPEEAKQES